MKQKLERKREKYKESYKKYRASKMGKEVHKKSNEKWNAMNRDKLKAERKLNNFCYRHGISNSIFICAICGIQPIQKHHENYDLWYSFIPLCKHHHPTVRL